MKNNQAMSYLIAANMEAVMLLLGAWQGGEWLNEKFPGTTNWYLITFSLAILIMIHSWYVIFRLL